MAHRITRPLHVLAACTLMTMIAPTDALAQGWPDRPVRVIVPAGAGGSADPLARLVAEHLAQALKQPFVVENRPGANGNVGSVAAVRSEPDGYTLLFSWTGTLVPALTLYHAKPYHPQKDLDPIVLIASVPNIIVAQPSTGIKTLTDLTAYAKKHPARLNFGSTGSGSSYHLSGELYKKTLGVDMTHVPYSSPSAVFADLLGDRLQLAFPGVTAAAPLIKDGQLQAVAIMAPKRSELLPNVPTTAELGQPSLLSDTWFGLLAPKGTPAEVISKANAAVNEALDTAAFRTKLVQMGFVPLGGSAADFVAVRDADITKWGEVVKFSGAKID